MGVDTGTPEQFSIRTKLLAIVYVLDKLRGYVFGHDCFNPETINKYCCSLLYLYRACNKVTQLSIPTHAQLQCH